MDGVNLITGYRLEPLQDYAVTRRAIIKPLSIEINDGNNLTLNDPQNFNSIDFFHHESL